MNFPGITSQLNVFLDELEDYNVLPEFRIHSMILRWESDIKGWNLGTVQTSGDVILREVSYQAEDVGLLKLSTDYLAKMAALAPGAYIKKTPKTSGWYVKNLRIDALLTDEAQGWLRAIAEFEQAVRSARPQN